MVIEAQMKAFSLLKYDGCFSVNKKPRTLVHSLNYSSELLINSKNMLGIYPQGQVYSFHLNKVSFEKGLDRILAKKTNPIQIIFVVTLIEYLDSFKPNAKVYY